VEPAIVIVPLKSAVSSAGVSVEVSGVSVEVFSSVLSPVLFVLPAHAVKVPITKTNINKSAAIPLIVLLILTLLFDSLHFSSLHFLQYKNTINFYFVIP
jgi:hypothetical protein